MSWILAFLGFCALIVLHEFGHFIAAKWTGMRVERFFLFFPPKAWSFKRGETEYGVGWIPLGGFVKITGMNPDDLEPRPPEQEGETPNDILNRIESSGQDDADDRLPDGSLKPEVAERAYYAQPVWKRIFVIGAGPFVNLVIAAVIFFGLGFGVEEPSGSGVSIDQLTDQSPAQGKIEPGDQIVSIDGLTLADEPFEDRTDEFRSQIKTHECAGGETENGCEAVEPVTVVLDRDGARKTVQVTPVYDEGAGQVLMGVAFEPTDGFVSAGYGAADAAQWAGDRMWFVTRESVSTIAQLFKAEKREQLSGVVGSYEATRQAIDFDTRTALGVLGLISLSLAIINLFPFLPLDGGHIFWSLVEKVRGRRVSFETMERAGAIGFVLILFLFFIGLSNDIGRLTGDGIDIQNPEP